MFSPAGGGGARRTVRRAPTQKQQQPQQGFNDSPTLGLVAAAHTIPPIPSSLTKHPSMAFRMTPMLKSGERSADASDPVFVCDFPHQFRNLVAEAQLSTGIRGGMDGLAGLSWVLYKNQIFVWSHLSHASSDCKVLNVPSALCVHYGYEIDPKHGSDWLVAVVRHAIVEDDRNVGKGCGSAGLVLCSQKTLAVAYWPDIFKDAQLLPVVSTGASLQTGERKLISSLIVTESANLSCVAVANCSNGDLCRIDCTTKDVSLRMLPREPAQRSELSFGPFDFSNSDAGRSLVWRTGADGNWRECLLLTSKGVECWDVSLLRGGSLSKAWKFDISQDTHTLSDLSGKKQIWLLDFQVTEGKNVTILAASLSKDRATSSSYMEYCLLTFLQVAPNRRLGTTVSCSCMQRKAPAQVILPKARVENEEFLYSMRLRMGGKPAGSAMILAGDGTATISHYLHGVVRLYQFDLAWDAGRVLDASVIPPLENEDEGAWVVLTDKAGVWAIPEKAVLLGAVEPPERSLSRKGSKNDEGRVIASAMDTDTTPSQTKESPSRQRLLQDEEAEALVGRLFQQYVTTKQAIGVQEKLQKSGAFQEDGEMNIFARFSKSIVDTIAKQWASVGGAGAAVIMGVASQLAEKQRRYQQYLSFLAATSCHGILQQYQRISLHTIMEHGEKLAAISKLKDMYNARAQNDSLQKNDSTGIYPETDGADTRGALWDTLQLVGEKARRKNVMLMDKENVEVFFTRVSCLEELFSCIEEHGATIVEEKLPVQRACELSDTCTLALKAAGHFKDSHHSWYPSAEGLTPWFCKAAVRSGICKVASIIVNLQASLDTVSKDKLMACLEELAEVLLESYTGAITAKIERDEEYRSLQTEYWSRRDEVFSVLQQYVRELSDIAAEKGEIGEQKRLEVLKSRYESLLSMARRHAGYRTLWEICIDLNDMQCLRALMHESMGLKEGRFSNYVFEQFWKMGQHGKLLRLGEEFPEELAAFLQPHKSLSWIHELYQKRFNAASNTMRLLAQSNLEVKVPLTRESVRGNTLTVAGRRKLLYLSKLAALAGGARDEASQIDADIGILAVQELAAELGFSDAEYRPPLELVEICLSSGQKKLVIRSLDIFAMAGDVFRRGNRSLLEATWLKLADQDEWMTMRKCSEEEGWNAEQQYEALKKTALFTASAYCYGDRATTHIRGLPFEETLPLFGDSGERATGSVLDILMQHPHFPEAGEAMVTALRMGAGLLETADDDFMEEVAFTSRPK